MQSLNRLKSTRKRKEYDFYETPYELCRSALLDLKIDEQLSPNDILDAGAGQGIWGVAANQIFGKDKIAIQGVDIEWEDSPGGYVHWYHGDYLEYLDYDESVYDPLQPDLVMGNPPYSLAEEFVRKSLGIVTKNGYVYFLLRLAFLESKKRHFGLFTEHPPKRVYVLSRRPSFFTTKEGRKTTDALSYAMFLWKEGWHGKTELSWMYWNYDE